MASAEIRVTVSDVPMNGMRQVEEGEAKVLFVRDADGVRAFQAKCPHYGAPLAKGAICGGKLYCPWHKAVFDVTDGALLEPPALDGLKRYPVRVEGDVAVTTLEAIAPEPPRPQGRDRTVVIVGSGAGGMATVTTLRFAGFIGRIVMIGREEAGPYDRTKLSKAFIAKHTDPASLLVHDFAAHHRVELVRGTAAVIEPAARRVTLDDGRTFTGDALVVATGSKAVVPDLPGTDLSNVHTLRSLDDGDALSAAAEGAKSVVVIGSGFIGLETAAFLTKRGLRATVVSPESLPFAKRFGDEVAAVIRKNQEAIGVTLLQGEVAALEGEGRVEAVVLKDGRRLHPDFVVIGAGARPETSAFADVPLREDGGIVVDATLRVAPGVWLAGDIAAYPEPRAGGLARIEHWRLAEQHGAYIAHAILGDTKPFTATPFFWSNQGDKRLDYAGYTKDWDRTITRGDADKLDFITFYVKDGEARAACAIGQNDQMIAFLHHLDAGTLPSANALEQDGLSLTEPDKGVATRPQTGRASVDFAKAKT